MIFTHCENNSYIQPDQEEENILISGALAQFINTEIHFLRLGNGKSQMCRLSELSN